MSDYRISCKRNSYSLVIADEKKLAIHQEQHRKRFADIVSEMDHGIAPDIDEVPFLSMMSYEVNESRDRHVWGFTTLIIKQVENGKTDVPLVIGRSLYPNLAPSTIELATSDIYRFLLANVPSYDRVTDLANNFFRYGFYCPTKKEALTSLKKAIVRKTIQLWTGRATPEKNRTVSIPIL